ncbi:two-component system CheB/CheR fusion protein [Modicisalibacter xianhensis]|uniref:protein-glutamate O-methyltransferase n=1 Tax=Modicisalibacter xianhensis TaxID=442341 RepID=A0A4V3GUZ1_9GAMM|nr:chemotaxis protein CheB [Halomonas xianhensis]TDX32796.1 two-component system CheB/CheR fusion protein [Halomonas xianhensis]
MKDDNPTSVRPTGKSESDSRVVQIGMNHSGKPTTVVGIGASAGGLAALKHFFERVPANSGLSFVVVMHLSPEYKSHLADLLQPSTSMPVQQVTETVPLLADHVYVIPPGCNLNTIDTHLRLSELEEKRRERAPIDHFFRTLAVTHDGDSIGVILTGTGSDGTLGIKEIKGRGGLTIVQDPNEAEFDGMPQSAISTRLIDKVLPLEAIPDEILRYTRTRPHIQVPQDGEELDEVQRNALQKIFVQIRARTGRDFSRYKRSTVMRRIQRRMQLHHVEELSRYLDLMRENPEETRALSDEFLITVTNFFRDREVFDALEKDIIPQLFQGKGPEDQVRAWSVGCATGEEAYSLAILLLEAAAKHDAPPQLQVFASDLHEHSLQTAREGMYSGDIEIDISEHRLRRYFTQESGGYRVRKEVREIVVFAPHNLLGDPPFSKLDLISCRNVMIYLQRDIQQDVIELFHYALKPDGHLLLGTSETADRSDLFFTENKQFCLYRKRNVPTHALHLPVFPRTQGHHKQVPQGNQVTAQVQRSYGELHQKMVERYAPPSILINPEHKIVHFSEHAGRYLVHPGGEPTSHVFKLVREELRLELRAAIVAADRDSLPVRSKPIPLMLEGAWRYVVMHVRPAERQEDQGLILIIFEERKETLREGEPVSEDSIEHSSKELEAELDLNKQRLQSVIEEYETSQEEMKAANEELQSANEELRSTMEELETSKEELQSMNEELATVNQENRHKVDELSRLSNDLQNLLTATDIATIFLDRELRILRFTPQVGSLFNIRVADRGRPLSDLTHRLGYTSLSRDSQHVLDELTPLSREIQDDSGRWYLTRIRPYRSSDDRISGVVLTFIDITDRKRFEEDLRISEERFRVLVDTSAQIIWTTEADGSVSEDSPSWRVYTGQTHEQFKGWGWLQAVKADDRQRAQTKWQKSVKSGKPFHTEFRIFHAPSGQYRWTEVRASALRNPDRTIRGWVGMNIDINEQKLAEQKLKNLNETLETRVNERTQEVRELASKLTMAEQEERRRVSQVLHDDLQQLLYGLQMKMRMLQEQIGAADPENSKETLASTLAWITEAIETTRQLTVDLSPPILKQEGLAEALEWLQRQMKQLHDLDVELQTRTPPYTPDEDLRVLLFQVVRELLFNAKKHAGVDQVRVELDHTDDHICIRVSDTGRGFDLAAMEAKQHEQPGFGLISIRERLRLLGGSMKIDSTPGDGTSILVKVPARKVEDSRH